MDDYSASYNNLEKLISAAQAIKENLICSICLEYFNEPVTIKCGHKFCKQCILRVTSNDNATCPFCNIKIQKRSIPKETNELLQKLVEQFTELTKAIKVDSGIDVLEPSKKIQHTKESTPLQEKSSTSKLEHVSNSSKESGIKSKVNIGSGKKLSLRKKITSSETKSSKDKSNTLDRYLSNNQDFVSNQIIPSAEKVSTWLKQVETDECTYNELNPCNESPCVTKLHEDETTSEKSLQQQLKEIKVAPLFEPQPSTSGLKNLKNSTNTHKNEKMEEPKFKEVQMRFQQAEKAAMARKNKLNQSVPEKTILRTPSLVPAASHSDHCDWRRVKQVGKEMQVKTFKSLSVSIEKNSPSVVLDDTVPCNSTNNDSKHFSRESDTNSHSLCEATVVEVKHEESLKITNIEQKEKCVNDLSILSYQQCTQDSSLGSEKAGDISLSCMDQKHINEIIGVVVKNTPEKTKNLMHLSNQEYINKVNHVSPYKIYDEKTVTSDDELENSYKKEITDIQSSPSKRKLSLKMKLTSSIKKPSYSQHHTPIETNKKGNESPEKLKSRLSLRIPSKSSEQILNLKSPRKNFTENNRSSKPTIVLFKKLGKFCKKPKKIPFLFLGKMKPRERLIFCSPLKEFRSEPVIISNVQTEVDYRTLLNTTSFNAVNNNSLKNTRHKEIKLLSPAKDSQLKFLHTNSPHCQQNLNNQAQIAEGKLLVNKLNRSAESMEIDETLPQGYIYKRKLEFEEQEVLNKVSSNKDKEENLQPSTSVKKILQDKNIIPDVIKDKEFISTSLDIVKIHDIIKIKSKSPFEVHKNCGSTIENSHPNPTQVEKSDAQENIPCSLNEKESKEFNTSNSGITISSKDDGLDQRSIIHNSEIDSALDSDSSVVKVIKPRKVKKSDIRVSTSSQSSSIKASPLKKKRLHSESSNDEEDVSSIIGKWCESKEEQVSKKPKINMDSQKNKRTNKLDKSNFVDSEEHDTNSEQNSEFNKLKADFQIDDIITKVKSFNDNETACKVINMPSSILSTDLFESNDQQLTLHNQTLTKQSNKSITHESSAKSWSSDKISDKENANLSQDVLEATVIDSSQFNKKKANLSIDSDSSNKENKKIRNDPNNISPIKLAELIGDQEDEIKNSQNKRIKLTKTQPAYVEQNSYLLPESLLNITQEQVAMKKIEKDLFGGVDLSIIDMEKNKTAHQPNKTSTPVKKIRSSQASDNTEDFDSDNIKATPVTKKRQLPNKSKKILEDELNELEISAKTESSNYIAAVTPFRQTKSMPLCHSTPMINTPSSQKATTKISLICSGLTPENIKVVQTFAKKFNGSFLTNFNMDVTHVIVQTDPETKAGQKTFKYIQGIAFKKHLISLQWIVDCLKQNRLLDENDEKYDVLDPDILESGSKKSRKDVDGLFKEFVFFCLEPFISISINEFKNILLHNGSKVVNSYKLLSQEKNKIKIIITETESLSQKKIANLKKSGGAIISFEWIVDSLSQYHILSLVPYLVEMTVEEVANLGIPQEYLVEDETVEEEEEEEEEEEKEEEEVEEEEDL